MSRAENYFHNRGGGVLCEWSLKTCVPTSVGSACYRIMQYTILPQFAKAKMCRCFINAPNLHIKFYIVLVFAKTVEEYFFFIQKIRICKRIIQVLLANGWMLMNWVVHIIKIVYYRSWLFNSQPGKKKSNRPRSSSLVKYKPLI